MSVYCFVFCSKILHSYGNVKVTISGTAPHEWNNSRVGRNPLNKQPITCEELQNLIVCSTLFKVHLNNIEFMCISALPLKICKIYGKVAMYYVIQKDYFYLYSKAAVPSSLYMMPSFVHNDKWLMWLQLWVEIKITLFLR